MPLQLDRRALAAGAAALLLSPPDVQAKPEQLFDVVTGDGAVVRNFRIAPELSPSNLPGVIMSGGPGAELTLYEFFDYACPFCRTATEEIEILLQPGGPVRLGLVQHPLLSQRSTDVALLVLAAAGKYGDDAAYRLHVACFAAPGRTSADKALAVAARQGLDIAGLRREADGAGVSAILAAQVARAQALSLPHVPSFVLGDFAFAGWPGVDVTESFFTAMRRCGGLRCAASTSSQSG
jgi:protein-disulfide isomerase